MRITLNGPQESINKQTLYEAIKYVEDNFLSGLGLHISDPKLYFTVYDEAGNRVYPSIQGMDVSIVHNLYTGEYEADINPKYAVPRECSLPIDNLLSDRKTLPQLEIVDREAAERLKKLRLDANMKVRQLCQKTGISGITICNYENGKTDIPDEDREVIEKAIADFAANPEELNPAEELSRIESVFPRPLNRTEKIRFCECISYGVTDEAIRNALEIGTYFSALELTGYDVRTAHDNCCKFADAIRNTIFYKKIMPAMINYHETEHYIFVHGWIPFRHVQENCSRIDDWRNAPLDEWKEARFENGMEAAAKKINEPGKTIVCGHWHASYGHAVLEGKGSEFGPDADFSPYYGEGVIAIDACTAYSGLMNCIVIED